MPTPMTILKISCCGVMLLLQQGVAAACPPRPIDKFVRCLPTDIKPNDIVSATMLSNNQIKQVTVQQTLKSIAARCKGTQLVDAKGREIRIVRQSSIGCGGAPPSEAMLAELRQQTAAIAKLKQRYTVIELTCNPGGIPLP